MNVRKQNPVIFAKDTASGFTRSELLVLICVGAVLIVLARIVATPRRPHHYLSCLWKLKIIGLSVQAFAGDHQGQTPWEVASDRGGTLESAASGQETFRHFQVLSNELSTGLTVVCPEDKFRFATNLEHLANANVSYFVDLGGRANAGSSILAGDRNITAASGMILLQENSAPLNWVARVGLHGKRGHLVFGDGHAEEVSSSGLSAAVQRTGIATNRFAIP